VIISLERAPQSSQALITTTESRDAILIHEEQSETLQPTEFPILISAPGSDQPAVPFTLEEARLKFKLEPNMTLSQDPDGKLVIQELDSPVTRREKAMRKKRARSQLVGPALTAFSILEGSDLSSLSELSEEDDGEVQVKKKIDGTRTKAPQPGEVVLEDGKTLEGGTLGAIFTFYRPTILTADFDLQSGRKLVSSTSDIMPVPSYPSIVRELPVVGCCYFRARRPDSTAEGTQISSHEVQVTNGPSSCTLLRLVQVVVRTLHTRAWFWFTECVLRQWVELDQLLLLGENDGERE
jgi:hypothetical protein